MGTSSAGFRVGAFVLAGAVALLALLFFLTGGRFNQGALYETYFRESVQGLDVGTAVKYRGVTVGQVAEMELAAAEYPPPDATAAGEPVYQQVMVRFRMDPDKVGATQGIKTAIAQGLRAQIVPQGITGLSYIDLSFVDPKTYPAQTVPWKPNETLIPSRPSTLAQVQSTLQNLVASLNQADIGKVAGQLGQLISTLNQEVGSGDAHQAVANANTLLATLNQVVQQSDLPGTAASIRNLAGGPQTRQLLTQLDQTTTQLAKVSAELPALVASSQSAVNQANETTADLQAQLLPILRDMKTTTDNLRDLSAELSANPGRILAGPPPQGSP
ncbi:MAG: MlaD family protein [Acidocella sp.]|nr:MlaD family protein [Acidocella sp.]